MSSFHVQAAFLLSASSVGERTVLTPYAPAMLNVPELPNRCSRRDALSYVIGGPVGGSVGGLVGCATGSAS
jgi:hypothetical protein